jgi:hypothetical protein
MGTPTTKTTVPPAARRASLATPVASKPAASTPLAKPSAGPVRSASVKTPASASKPVVAPAKPATPSKAPFNRSASANAGVGSKPASSKAATPVSKGPVKPVKGAVAVVKASEAPNARRASAPSPSKPISHPVMPPEQVMEVVRLRPTPVSARQSHENVAAPITEVVRLRSVEAMSFSDAPDHVVDDSEEEQQEVEIAEHDHGQQAGEFHQEAGVDQSETVQDMPVLQETSQAEQEEGMSTTEHEHPPMDDAHHEGFDGIAAESDGVAEVHIDAEMQEVMDTPEHINTHEQEPEPEVEHYDEQMEVESAPVDDYHAVDHLEEEEVQEVPEDLHAEDRVEQDATVATTSLVPAQLTAVVPAPKPVFAVQASKAPVAEPIVVKQRSSLTSALKTDVLPAAARFSYVQAFNSLAAHIYRCNNFVAQQFRPNICQECFQSIEQHQSSEARASNQSKDAYVSSLDLELTDRAQECVDRQSR